MSQQLTDTLARRFFYGAPQDVLVIGCGLGKFARELSSLGHRVWACQESFALTLQLQKWADERGNDADFFAADPLHRQPFSDGFFDSVVIEEEIACTVDVNQLFIEACRMTRPGGTVVGTHMTHNVSPRRQVRMFTAEQMYRFVTSFHWQAGAEILPAGFVFWIPVSGGSQ